MTTIDYRQIDKPTWRISCEAETEPPSPRSEFGAGSKGELLNKLQKARSIYW